MHHAVKKRFGSLKEFFTFLHRRLFSTSGKYSVNDNNDDNESPARLGIVPSVTVVASIEMDSSVDQIQEDSLGEAEPQSSEASPAVYRDHGEYRVLESGVGDDCSICAECEFRHGVETLHVALHRDATGDDNDDVSLEGLHGLAIKSATSVVNDNDDVDDDDDNRIVGDCDDDNDDSEIQIVEGSNGDDNQTLCKSEIESRNDDDNENDDNDDDYAIQTAEPSWEDMILRGGGEGIDNVSVPSCFEAVQAYYHL